MGKHSTKESRRTLSHELEIDSLSAAINAPGQVMELSGLICVDEHFVARFLGRLLVLSYSLVKGFFFTGFQVKNQRIKKPLRRIRLSPRFPLRQLFLIESLIFSL